MTAGADASTKFYSKDGTKLAKQPKELFIIEGRDNTDLYDNITESGPKPWAILPITFKTIGYCLGTRFLGRYCILLDWVFVSLCLSPREAVA